MDEELHLTGSVEAQQAVIGSMLIDEKCIGLVMSSLSANDFTDGPCRTAYIGIKRQFVEGKPVDFVTLLNTVGGGSRYAGWLREVMELTPTAANVAAYIEKVLENAEVCRLREIGAKMAETGDLDGLHALVRKANAATSAASRVSRMTARELAEDFLRRMTDQRKPEYLPWGIPAADQKVYAELGDLCLLGGYASAGKTLLSLQMALAQAKRYRVGYYTLETRPEKMADRMFAHLAKLPMTAIKRREITEGDLRRAADAADLFTKTCPIDFVRAAGLSVEDIAADAIAHRYQVIYVDYLQLIEVPGIRAGDRYGAVTAVSRGLKLFAQSHNVAVVALAQLSRPQPAGGKNGQALIPPSMHSFRESGQIEQDADVAFLLWAKDENDNNSKRRFKLGKNKEGEKFLRCLAFDGDTQTMVETEDDDDDDTPPSKSNSVAAHYSEVGKAVKQRNRAAAKVPGFTELPEDSDCPFPARAPS